MGVKVQWTTALAAKPDLLSLIPQTHMTKGRNPISQLSSTHMCGGVPCVLPHTERINKRINFLRFRRSLLDDDMGKTRELLAVVSLGEERHMGSHHRPQRGAGQTKHVEKSYAEVHGQARFRPGKEGVLTW